MKKIHYQLSLGVILLLLSGCAGNDPVVIQEYKAKPAFVTSELTATKTILENAFIEADSKKIESYIEPRYLDQYKSAIEANPTKLAEFGKLFKSMKLIAGDSINAFYQIEYKGAKYEVSFTKDNTGNWKLVNF